MVSGQEMEGHLDSEEMVSKRKKKRDVVPRKMRSKEPFFLVEQFWEDISGWTGWRGREEAVALPGDITSTAGSCVILSTPCLLTGDPLSSLKVLRLLLRYPPVFS